MQSIVLIHYDLQVMLLHGLNLLDDVMKCYTSTYLYH